MNAKELEKKVAQAQQELQALELRALTAERQAKAAKAKAKRLKLEHQRAKKTAKAAKRLALRVAEAAQDQCRVLEKAERRLAKARRKMHQVRPAGARALVPAPVGRVGPLKAVTKPPGAARGSGGAISMRRSSGNGHPHLAAAHTPEDG